MSARETGGEGRPPRAPRRGPGRWLRQPRLVVAEVLLVALAGVVSTLVPQAAEDPAGPARFAAEHPHLAPWVRLLGLHAVFGSRWFLALCLLAAASLVALLVLQWRRVAAQWGASPRPESFASAPLRAELVREASGGGAAARVRSTGRVALLGSPVFHLGLLVLVCAGLSRMLFAADAVVDLVEGEAVPAGPGGWIQSDAGWFARPMGLEVPVRLDELQLDHYATGELLQLGAALTVGEGERAVVAVNSPFDGAPGGRIYVAPQHGPAAFIEVRRDGGLGRVDRRLLLLRDSAVGHEAVDELAPGLELRLRGEPGPAGRLPARLEARLLRNGVLLGFAPLAPGGVLRAGGVEVTLVGLRWWGRLHGARDPSGPIAYAGLALVVLGAFLYAVVVRVDQAVIVTPCPEGERVLVALRPARLVPLYRDRFERLVQDVKGGRA